MDGMAFTEKTITAAQLRDYVKTWFEYGHDDGSIDEPYEGAGYCTCIDCQEMMPRLEAAAATIAALEEELAIVKADYNSMNKIADYIVQVAHTIAQERDALSAEMAAIVSRAMDQAMNG